jgi:hypothetical protein
LDILEAGRNAATGNSASADNAVQELEKLRRYKNTGLPQMTMNNIQDITTFIHLDLKSMTEMIVSKFCQK